MAEVVEFWVEPKDLWCCQPCIELNGRRRGRVVKGWLCDRCGEPFQPKAWEARYSTCQRCHYGS